MCLNFYNIMIDLISTNSKYCNEVNQWISVSYTHLDNKNNINLEEYNNILTNRKTMVKNIEKEVSKIDYKGAEVFKSNLTLSLIHICKKSN